MQKCTLYLYVYKKNILVEICVNTSSCYPFLVEICMRGTLKKKNCTNNKIFANSFCCVPKLCVPKLTKEFVDFGL
jgi:hypothetical protein